MNRPSPSVRSRARLAICAWLALAFLGPARAAAAPIALDFTGGDPLQCGAGCTVGWAFRVVTPIVVEGLAVWDEGANGLLAPHHTGIFSNAGALLSSTFVSSASTPLASTAAGGQWLVEPIAPLLLAPGFYTIGALYGPVDPDAFRGHAVASVIPEIFYLSSRFSPGAVFQMPLIPQAPFENGFFGASFTAAPHVVPEPTTMLLVGTGIGVLVKRRRKSC